MATTGFWPSHATPAANVTACCSAMPTSKYRCGKRCSNSTRPLPSRMAGVTATRRESCCAVSHSHVPNTCVKVRLPGALDCWMPTAGSNLPGPW
ncbi:hypothetical protein D3C72_2340270 [compost metagenome]